MSMINAEVTAENKPDSQTHQPCWLCKDGGTHKNESSIQILVVFLLKFIVMFSDFLLELVVEIGPGVGAAIPLQHRL